MLLALLITARALIAAAVPEAWRWPDAGHGPRILHAALPLAGGRVRDRKPAAGDRGARGRSARAATSRARGTGPHRAATVGFVLAFAGTHLAAGVAVAGILIAHHRLLERLLEHATLNPVQFSLHPFEPQRLAFVLGVFAIHAATLWGAILTLRFAALTWRVSRRAWAACASARPRSGCCP